MHIEVASGTYVVAVSGGVDSMALLHALSSRSDLTLIVAHVDHGMRPDSAEDARTVRAAAEEFGYQYEVIEALLDPSASEDVARKFRYNFFRVVRAKYDAKAIITAHHADDVIETAIINMSRGTGRHGLSSLRSTNEVLRPLLKASKQDILRYAEANKVQWREDSSNVDTKYLRNHIRHNVVRSMKPTEIRMMHGLIQTTESLNSRIDTELDSYLMRVSYRRQQTVYSRLWFNRLPHAFACDIVHFWLRRLRAKDYSRPQIDKLVVSIKTARPGSSFDIGSGQKIMLTKRSIRLPNGP